MTFEQSLRIAALERENAELREQLTTKHARPDATLATDSELIDWIEAEHWEIRTEADEDGWQFVVVAHTGYGDKTLAVGKDLRDTLDEAIANY